MERTAPDTRHKRIGRWFGAASIVASAGSYAAFVLYARWHWELVRLGRIDESDYTWHWRAVESLKLLNIALGLAAVVLLLLAAARRSWVASLLALGMAVLCLWTVPLIA